MNCEGCSKHLDPAKDRFIKLVDFPAMGSGTTTVDVVCCDWDCARDVATVKDEEERERLNDNETT